MYHRPLEGKLSISSVRESPRTDTTFEGDHVLLIIGIVLLVIAIAGGAIVHPVLFALAIVALVLFFMNR